MSIFDVREPVSTWTHALGLILAIPATIFLWKRCGRDLKRGLSLAVFGVSLACCYLGSALFHGVHSDKAGLDVYDRLDHVGIFLLIAGSYTPLAVNLLNARWRRGVLFSVWGMAVAGSLLYLELGVLPALVGTLIYVAMGWGAIFCYAELSRTLTQRQLLPLLLGGIIYTVGAVLNLTHWPRLWPHVFGPHETFHIFVLAGSFCHFLFMLNVVVPARDMRAVVPTAGTDAVLDPAPQTVAGRRRADTLASRGVLVPVRNHPPR